MFDSDPQGSFSYVIEALNSFDLAYLHLMKPNEIDLKSRDVINPVLPIFRPFYQDTIITNGGYEKETENNAIASGNTQLVYYGKLFLANPDLPQRFTLDAELNEPNPQTFYGRGNQNAEVGYTNYPFLVN